MPPPSRGPFPATFRTKHGIRPLVQGHLGSAFPALPVALLQVAQNGHGPCCPGLEVAIPWPLKGNINLSGSGFTKPDRKAVRSGHNAPIDFRGSVRRVKRLGNIGRLIATSPRKLPMKTHVPALSPCYICYIRYKTRAHVSPSQSCKPAVGPSRRFPFRGARRQASRGQPAQQAIGALSWFRAGRSAQVEQCPET